MSKKEYIILLFIGWIFACIYIAYEGQFISGYLESRGMQQEDYSYPSSGVLFTCTLYTVVFINYFILAILKTTAQYPVISYIAFSILPLAIGFLSFLGAMHASSYWGAFILLMMLTLIIHFFILPFILYHCSKNQNI
jgi:hypothetical protein